MQAFQTIPSDPFDLDRGDEPKEAVRMALKLPRVKPKKIWGRIMERHQKF